MKTAEKTTKFRCSKCHGTSIQRVRWVDPNTNRVIEGEDPFEDPIVANWCDTCQDHLPFETFDGKD